jgi:arylsulfatase A-like enzyme
MLVVADTTRADAFDAEHSPLAAAGRVYARAIAPAPWTAPSHASMLTGLAPSEHGVWRPNLFDEQDRPRPKPVGGELAGRWLPARLAAAGYRTLGVSANPWVVPYFGFDHGFERFLSIRDNPSGRTRQSRAVRLARLLPDAVGNRLRRRRLAADIRRRGQDWGARRALATFGEWIGESDRPFFAFLNLMEAHWPYRPAADFEGWSSREADEAIDLLARLGQWKKFTLEAFFGQAALSPREQAVLRRLYAGEVAYLRERLAELLDRLDLDDTVVVVVSDHGEQLGEHGLYGHGSSLYEGLLHVPLLVLGPKDLVGRGVEHARVGTRSLHGAFQAWSRGEAARLDGSAPLVAEGEGMWWQPVVRRMPAAASSKTKLQATSWALYDGDWKYVRDETGAEVLYDLATDPAESADVGAAGPLDAMRRRLAEALAARRSCLLTPAPGERDPAVEAELRALGYL